MAVVSIATLKGYFNTGDTPTELNYIDLIDTLAALPTSSGEPVWKNLSANGLTCKVIAFGSGSPTLTESATAQYTLVYPDTATPLRAVISFDSDNWDGSGNMTLLFTNTNNLTIECSVEMWRNDNDQRISDPKAEFNIAMTRTVVEGSTTIAFTNLSNLAASGATLVIETAAYNDGTNTIDGTSVA